MEFKDITGSKKPKKIVEVDANSLVFNGEKVDFVPEFNAGDIVAVRKEHKGYSTQLERIYKEEIPCVVIECKVAQLNDMLVEVMYLEPKWETKKIKEYGKLKPKKVKRNILENPFLVQHFKKK